MNKTKRYLIIAAAILNIVTCVANLILSALINFGSDEIYESLIVVYDYLYTILGSSALFYSFIWNVISFAVSVAGSVLLIYSVRKGGKYFRRSQGLYITGLVIVIFFGGWIPWLLLFISMFIPNVVVMNTPREVKQEEKMEQAQTSEREKNLEEKTKKIEELKSLRDNGLISEEEYKEKLFEIL